MKRIVRIFKNLNSMAKSCADFVFKDMLEVLKKKGEVSFILSGDVSPLSFYKYFALDFKKTNLPKNDIYWFLANERWESRDNSLNNACRLDENLFLTINPPFENVFPWRVMEIPPADCAERMNRSIINHFIDTKKTPDITILSVDDSGNTAALVPGIKKLTNGYSFLTPREKRYALPLYEPRPEKWSMSLTPAILNRSEKIIFLITGKKSLAVFQKYLKKDPVQSLYWIRGKEMYFYMTEDTAGDYLENYGHRNP